ncbi:MAG: hypothetical protein KAS72_09710 [Phycisphaerales bacterium]|nr:hypothetical protein [Phycisphaerales bacterium]
MSRLSISSSDSLDLRGLRPWGLLVCLALLAVVEFGMARQDWLWSMFPKSPSGIVDVLEEQVIEPAPSPVVVILGNSRTRDAIIPAEMEEVLGVPHGSVLNLSLTAGEPYDSYVLYVRNREKLSQARVLMIAIEDWNLNDNQAISERFRRFATLSDRLGAPDWKDRLSLVAGWVWRTYDARKPLGRLLKEMVLRRDRSVPIGEDGRVVWRTDDPEFGPEDVDVSADLDHAYRGFDPSRSGEARNVEYFRRLIALATEDGLHVLLIHPPFRDKFIDKRDSAYPQARASFRAVLDELARMPGDIHVLESERASELGIAETCFLDYGHMLASGARIYTRWTATWIRDECGDALALGR